jgi:hypothetical protein
MKQLSVIKGIPIFQNEAEKDGNITIHYIAGLAVDVDGSRNSYRLDNNPKLALDDIHASAGYPQGDWWNVLVRDPKQPSKPYVDQEGYCISMTSYQRDGYSSLDRRRYLDAAVVRYIVAPGIVRKLCTGILLGCHARIINTMTKKVVEGVMGDFSGYSIGEAALATARHFNPQLSARNGEDKRIYRYEFFPNVPAEVDGEKFILRPTAR